MSLVTIAPMLPVQDLASSVAFYEKLGFEIDQLREDWGWASLTVGGCRLMLDRSIGTGVHASRNAVIYLYVEHVQEIWQRTRDAGLDTPPITETFYGMQEFRVLDPSGNQVWVGQTRAQPAV